MNIIRFDSWIQTLCPAPRRHLARLCLSQGLKTGLDIGCGVSSPLTQLRAHGFHSTGLDVSTASILQAKERNLHDQYIEGDLRSAELEGGYDVVTCCHVIEHLSRGEGEALLGRLEEISRYVIYIETPNGFREQVSDELPQRHRSGWFAHDFEARGYTVYGSGVRGLRGSWGGARIGSEPVTRTIDRAGQWLVFRNAKLASGLSALRVKDRAGNLRQA